MNVNPVITKDYEKRTLGERGKNKPNSKPIKPNTNPIKANTKPIKANTNPIKPNQNQNKPNTNPNKANFRKAQMNVNSLITKDYRKKDDFTVRINKPNFFKSPK